MANEMNNRGAFGNEMDDRVVVGPDHHVTPHTHTRNDCAMQTYHSPARDAFAYTGVDDVERLVVVAFKGNTGNFADSFLIGLLTG